MKDTARVPITARRGSRCLVALPLLLAASPVAAQAILTGVVRENGTGHPLAGAEVLVEALGHRAVTDSSGRFVMGGLALGMRTALVRLIGYHPVEVMVNLVVADTLRLSLALEPTTVRFDPVEVRVARAPGLSLEFTERRRLGFGHFIDPEEIRSFDRMPLPNVLRRITGIRLAQSGQALIAMSSRQINPREACYMQVYLDGNLLYPTRGGGGTPPDLNRFLVSELEAIEVYRSLAETPGEFASPSARCGTIVLWTRRYTPPRE